jgi:hypothetical protein
MNTTEPTELPTIPVTADPLSAGLFVATAIIPITAGIIQLKKKNKK